MGRPEEIATVALFLASSDSGFVTGSELLSTAAAQRDSVGLSKNRP
jgi:NAD(P)-dependent dehydrogenase (short-subunit alcohol dehydrogenase family)